ncbi:DUF2784 domain-containing protein [Trichloromonas sp.]|uniref:DUF2784 domain-containing protein n=1 Tax=Trichloromonas sp. TaxID=3069249 RepID=UPI003D81A770
MPYALLADLALLLHFGFILFVVAGGWAVLRRPRLAWLHLPAAAWGTAVEIGGWFCPLTDLENHWRRLGGGSGYDSSFIDRYLTPLIYPDNLTRETQIILGLLVLTLNLLVYGWLLLAKNRPPG